MARFKMHAIASGLLVSLLHYPKDSIKFVSQYNGLLQNTTLCYCESSFYSLCTIQNSLLTIRILHFKHV